MIWQTNDLHSKLPITDAEFRGQGTSINCTITQAEEKAKIHGYLALTRLLDLMLRDDGEDVDTLTELLAQYGITRTGNDLDDIDFDLPLNNNDDIILPESAPSGEAIRSFIAGPFLNVVNASIADMDEVLYYCGIADQFGLDTSEIITAEEIDLEADSSDPDIEIDEGDYYLFRAGLKTMKAFVLIITAYDLNVDIREIVALGNLDAFNIKGFLERYPDFLNLLTSGGTPNVDGAAQLAQAKTALLGAIDDYLTASDKIRNESEPEFGVDELIEIDKCELREEEWFRTNLTKIKTSLINSTVFQFIDKEETWVFTDGGSPGKTFTAYFWDDMSFGDYDDFDDCDFIGCGGEIDCITINDNQITLEFEGRGPNGWTEATFTGTFDSASGKITGGNYNGTDDNGPFSGTFTAIRTEVEQETDNIDLNPFFGGGNGPYNLRDMLPEFNDCDEPVYGTMGHGLGNDPTLGGILPDYDTQEDWDLESEPSGTVDIRVVHNGDITVDGNLDDWTAQGVPSVYTDVSGNDDPNLNGTDIKALYLAKDDDYLYLAMTLYDGPPSQDVMYWFVAANEFDEYDSLGELSTDAIYYSDDGWVSEVISRGGDWQRIGYHPGDAVPGSDAIEWRVPLTEMGNLSGKFIRLYTHAHGPYPPSEDHFPCLRISPMTTITGTLTVPEHDGTGPIYIGVFRYDGSYNSDPDNRIGQTIIYPKNYSDTMTYTVTNLPVGEAVFVTAHWDADFNGLLTSGDWSGSYINNPVTVSGEGNTGIDLDLAYETRIDPGTISGRVVDQLTGEAVEDASCGSIELDVGWHKFVYRQEECDGYQASRAAFKSPSDTEWRWFSTSQLMVRTAPDQDAQAGLLLINKKNTWEYNARNHQELVKCVDQDATSEPGWYGESVVSVVNQDENLHGNDDYYTSYYEAYFYVDTLGTWWFATASDDTSEIVIDEELVAFCDVPCAYMWEHKGWVDVYDWGTYERVRFTSTNADGTYRISGLPSGNYRVEATAPGYINEFFEEAAAWDEATPVILTDLEGAADINFTLEKCAPALVEWMQVNEDGFGDPNNRWIRGMCVIDGNLYAGIQNTATGTQVWMYDGTTWSPINSPGFGDVNNQAIWGMLEAEFGGARGLLVATTNYVTGCELWFYDGVTWTAKATGGFGELSNTQASLAEFGGNYYAGTTNEATGTEVRMYNGTNWEQVNGDGFGDVNNRHT